MMGEATWWYEWNAAQAGPVSEASLLDMIHAGHLPRDARVWRAGMPTWLPVAAVPELAPAIPSDRTPFTPPPLVSRRLAALPAGMEPVSTGAVVGLGIVTLGIYPVVKFYQAALAYEELAGRRSRFVPYFWVAVALFVLSGPLHLLGPVVGYGAHVGFVLLTILTLLEALGVRGDVVRRHGIAASLTSDRTHEVLFIVGVLTSWLLVGVALLLVEAVKLFDDHRAIGDALRGRSLGTPGPSPTPPAA